MGHTYLYKSGFYVPKFPSIFVVGERFPLCHTPNIFQFHYNKVDGELISMRLRFLIWLARYSLHFLLICCSNCLDAMTNEEYYFANAELLVWFECSVEAIMYGIIRRIGATSWNLIGFNIKMHLNVSRHALKK